MRILVLIVIAINLNFTGNAQEKIESTEQLSFMVGDWKGEGWLLGKDRTKKYFSQSEKIQSKLEGQALMIDGLGHAIDSTGSTTNRVIHEAFGIISFNDERNTVTMITFSKIQGRMESNMMLLNEKKLQWSFKDKSGATIRFTEDFSKVGKWKEIGEISINGKDWYHFFEMTLSKQ